MDKEDRKNNEESDRVFAVTAQERVYGYLVSDKPTTQSNAVHDYIGLYQKYVSGLKSGRCAMYPSCSNYGLQFFGEYPFFKVMGLISDRLIRCSHNRICIVKPLSMIYEVVWIIQTSLSNFI